ncbi:DJ-1/PfpI family protein [Kingella sp. SNUBH-2017]|uniref:DJ-1/PfpI family protein n=1 Tax=Kingella sp. SNUBH-2017 TaxID=2994077 RepID=UPI0023631A90|nr:DJ-1/PfpI family protein [Kingella sp. SNUBH-2017]MDD2182278.1 DJ-1/PfpI family protein [Kingella sp. SNUBH-2017]
MKTVAIILLEQFADWEAALLAPALQQFAGYTVCYVSTDRNPKTSMGNLRVQPDLTLDEPLPDAAALILIGATQSWRDLSDENRLKIAKLAHAFKQQGRIVGGICDGAYFLADNGLLNDCRHTANSLSEIADLPGYTNRQAYVETKREAVRDGSVITANAMAFADFAIQILSALGDVSEDLIAQCREMWQ